MAVQPKQYDLILSRRADFSLRLGFKSSVIVKTSDVNLSTNVITVEEHGLSDGNAVTYSAENATLLAPLVSGTIYYVRDKTDDTFKLATYVGGSAIDLTSQGNSSQTFTIKNNLTGMTIESQIWDHPNRTLKALDFSVAYTSPTTGIVDLSLTDEQTATLTADTYNYDVLLTNGAGLKEYYLKGKITVNESYTT